jgi:hypothetical protein
MAVTVSSMEQHEEEGRKLTPEELRRQKRRSVALALFLGFLAILFFVTTIVRLGGNVANRVI